jgi:hypothetical protein
MKAYPPNLAVVWMLLATSCATRSRQTLPLRPYEIKTIRLQSER